MPLVPVYAAGVALRAAAFLIGAETARRLRWPVISVGNLSAGGTGKTPFTIALAEALTREGIFVDVLSRGYGRRSSAVAQVDPAGTAEDFGDEPLLIARDAGVPVYVGHLRYDAGVLAERQQGARPGVHLLDDGFQHRQLHRDIDILILNSQDWFEDKLLPAGNLREPRSAIKRATVIAIPAEDATIEPSLRSANRFWEGPVWRFRREMAVPEILGPVVAFCGIARPEQFFSGLASAGIQLAAKHAFRDHHRFETRDLLLLNDQAKKAGAVACVTTAKDRIRLGKLEAQLEPPLHTAGLRVLLEDEAGAIAWLKARLASERFGAELWNRGPE
jgi:tetraacyldisaccharide 4'-kinase